MWSFTRTSMVLFSALVAGGLAVGCGDEGSGGGDLDTGLDPSKLLSSLTDDEKVSACQHLNAGAEARVSDADEDRAQCTYLALVTTDTPEACATQRDACIQQANSQQQVEEDDSAECSDVPDLSTCEGTVGEYETCLNDRLDQAEAARAALDCADAGEITEENVDERIHLEEPASCERFEPCDL